jgi:periplasmic protein TonB
MKKMTFLAICLLLSTGTIFAQDDKAYDISAVEVMPGFPGGQDSMMQFIRKNTKYPKLAKENGVSGKVFVEFIIDQDGKVTDVTIKKGVKVTAPDPKDQGDYDAMAKSMDDEAMRVIRSMPKWTPGSVGGKPVKVRYILPFNFKLK